MRAENQTRALSTQGTAIAAPISLGFADCAALVLSALLLATAILWPRRGSLEH